MPASTSTSTSNVNPTHPISFSSASLSILLFPPFAGPYRLSSPLARLPLQSTPAASSGLTRIFASRRTRARPAPLCPSAALFRETWCSGTSEPASFRRGTRCRLHSFESILFRRYSAAPVRVSASFAESRRECWLRPSRRRGLLDCPSLCSNVSARLLSALDIIYILFGRGELNRTFIRIAVGVDQASRRHTRVKAAAMVRATLRAGLGGLLSLLLLSPAEAFYIPGTTP